MKIRISILIILVSSTCFGQQAKALLEEVSEKVRSYDNIQIEFKYNLDNQKEGVSQQTTGDLTLLNDKYVINMLDITRMFDGSFIYTIIPEDQEVTISLYNPEDEKDITPSQMLTFYEEG